MADPLRVVPMTSPGELLHSLLAVSHAPAPEFLLSVNVAGFIYVSDVDVTRNTVRRRNPARCALFSVYRSRAKQRVAMTTQEVHFQVCSTVPGGNLMNFLCY